MLLGVVALAALPARTQAQEREIWSATLTVSDTPFASIGCSGCTEDHLSDRTFYFGRGYTVREITLYEGTLSFAANSRLSGSAERLVLQIGGFSRRFSERNSFFANVNRYLFTGTGLSWSLDDRVAVRIVDLPRITDVAVMSTPRAATDTYGAGETIEIWVTFSDAVNATANTDLVLSVSGRKRAALLRGSGTKTLVFGYTVQAGDEDDNGIFVGDGDDTLVGDRGGNPQSGAITLVANGDEVDLTHDEVGRLSGHKVDGSLTPPANEAPVITTTSPVAVAENETAVATLAATDADDDPITWSKTGGADAGRFALTDAGVLTFEAAPDYESPADVASADPANDASNNEYVVFVTARDGADFTELELVVQVTNANEATGTVTIDDTTPSVADELTATAADVADPDGLPEPFAPAWQWYRTPAAGAETAIAAATSSTYTVVRADVGAALTAKASWTDGDGFENTLASSPTAAVSHKLPVIVPNGVSITSSAPGDDEEYVTGDVIRVTVTFDEAVTVDEASGTPRLALTVGSNSRPAAYSATASTATELVFAYAVTVDDQDRDGIAIAADALELNGAAIHKQGETSAAAVLDHAALSTQSSHRVNLPTVISSGGVAVISPPRTYGVGETIEIEVAFSRPVNATSDTDFVLSADGRKRAPLLRGNGTATLVFGYTVQDTDQDDDGIWIGNQDRTLVGNRSGDPQTGTITSVATGREADLTHGSLGNQADHNVDGTLAAVTIKVDRPAFTAELDSVTFTLERTGSTAAALDVDVALTQDREFLATEYRSPTVAFQAGESRATLTVHRSWFEEVDRDGTLTATVQPGTDYVPGTANSATAQMLVVPVAVTIRLDRGSYAFDEDAAAADRSFTVIARTEPGIPKPLGFVAVSVSVVAIEGEARLDDDFEPSSEQLLFLPSDFSQEGSVYVARKAVVLELVDDALVEDAETLTLILQTAAGAPRVVAIVQHDGSSTACTGTIATVCTVTATIIDDDEPDRALPTAGGATWTLIGERTPAPGGTYTYSIMLASGTKPAAEVVGFSARAGGPSTEQLGADPTACTAPLQFCASVPGALVARWLPDAEGGYAIFALLADAAPHTATATLAIATDTPAGTTITFGPMNSALIPRAGGMTITVTERGGALPTSNDATLRGLAVNDGTSDLRLTPTFTWTTTSYAALVANTVDQVTVTPATNDDAATVAYPDASDNELDDADDGKDGFQVALANGTTTIRVKVTAADGATTQTYTVTLTRAEFLVAIAADQPAFIAEIDDVSFTLTRTGSTAAALTVAVALTQGEEFLVDEDLAHTVTFQAGEREAALLVDRSKFQGHTATRSGTLTATVQTGTGYEPGSVPASTRMLVVPDAVTVRFADGSYTFAEDATGAASSVAVIATTAPDVPKPTGDFGVGITTAGIAGQAQAGADFDHQAAQLTFQPSDFSAAGSVFTARTEVELVLVDDAFDEPDETFAVLLTTGPATPLKVVAFSQHDGSACDASGCRVTVTITDNDEPDVTEQPAGDATWTLTGESTPAPGDTYTYTIELASGTKPLNEYVGFYLPDSATNQDLLGDRPRRVHGGEAVLRQLHRRRERVGLERHRRARHDRRPARKHQPAHRHGHARRGRRHPARRHHHLRGAGQGRHPARRRHGRSG